jgi:hypothetical protein
LGGPTSGCKNEEDLSARKTCPTLIEISRGRKEEGITFLEDLQVRSSNLFWIVHLLPDFHPMMMLVNKIINR